MPGRSNILHIETAYPYKCSCPACINYPPSTSARAHGFRSPNLIDPDTPPASPAPTPDLSTVGSYTAASTTPPIPTSRESLYKDPAFNQYWRREQLMQREVECYVQSCREWDMLAHPLANRAARTDSSRDPIVPTFRGTKGEYVEKTPETKMYRAYADPMKKAADVVRESKSEEDLQEDMRVLAKKMAEVNLAAEDADDEEDDDEWERVVDPVQAEWELVDMLLQ